MNPYHVAIWWLTVFNAVCLAGNFLWMGKLHDRIDQLESAWRMRHAADTPKEKP